MSLLWFDDTPGRSMEDKIAGAVHYFRKKLGQEPDTCRVNLDTWGSKEVKDLLVDGRPLRVEPAPNVTVHHFWVLQDSARF